METEERGFKVGTRFYPAVPIDDWLNQDFILARTLTRVSVDELLGGQGDYLAVQQALLAVAVWHKNPQQTMDRVIQHVYGIKPADIEEVGFEDLDAEEEDARPPDEDASATPSSSSESGAESSEPS